MRQPKFVTLIIHEPWGTWFHDDAPKFGFSSRAAYAMGLDKPNYPMPTIPIVAGYDFDGGFVGVCIIERPQTEDYRIVFDLWDHTTNIYG